MQQVADGTQVARDRSGPDADAGLRDASGAERRRGALELVDGRIDDRGPRLQILMVPLLYLRESGGELVELLGGVGEVERGDLGDKVRVGVVLFC